METKNREKMLLIIVAVAIGLYLLNVILISPLSDSWTTRRKTIADLKDKIRDGVATKANAKTIEDKWNSMSTNTLPGNPTLAENQLFKAFQGWALASRVNLVAQKPETKDSDEEGATYKNEEWHADVTGSLNQIFSFLYNVESTPMGLKVESIELSSRDDRGIQLALGLTVSGLILNPSTNSVQP